MTSQSDVFRNTVLYVLLVGEGRKPGPRVIPTCIAFWPVEKELNPITENTPRWNLIKGLP